MKCKLRLLPITLVLWGSPPRHQDRYREVGLWEAIGEWLPQISDSCRITRHSEVIMI